MIGVWFDSVMTSLIESKVLGCSRVRVHRARGTAWDPQYACQRMLHFDQSLLNRKYSAVYVVVDGCSSI